MFDNIPVLTRKRLAIFALTLIGYVVAATTVYLMIDQRTIKQAFSLPITLLVLMLALSLVNYALRAWRWLFLTRRLRLPVTPYHSGLYYLAGYALTATPGKAGEAVRLWLLKSGHDVPYANSAPLLLADRMVDIWAITLLASLSMSGFDTYRWHSLAVGTLIALISIPILSPGFVLSSLRWVGRSLPSCEGILSRVRNIIDLVANAIDLPTYVRILLPTLVGWLAEGTALYLVLTQLQASISFADALFVFSFSMIIGAISMLPGGLGSMEITMVVLLKTLGVELNTALAATAIVRFTTFWFAIILGSLCLPAAVGAANRASSARHLARSR